MNNQQASEITELLGKYNQHFTELFTFLTEKQNKVFADDLVWLHDSLTEEQRLVMKGNSIETKRIEMLKKMNFDGYTSSKLIDECPDDFKGKMKLEISGMENSIDRIRKINADILEAVEKKLSAAENFLKEKGLMSTDIYGEAGAKVRLDYDDDIIGSI